MAGVLESHLREGLMDAVASPEDQKKIPLMMPFHLSALTCVNKKKKKGYTMKSRAAVAFGPGEPLKIVELM